MLWCCLALTGEDNSLALKKKVTIDDIFGPDLQIHDPNAKWLSGEETHVVLFLYCIFPNCGFSLSSVALFFPSTCKKKEKKFCVTCRLETLSLSNKLAIQKTQQTNKTSECSRMNKNKNNTHNMKVLWCKMEENTDLNICLSAGAGSLLRNQCRNCISREKLQLLLRQPNWKDICCYCSTSCFISINVT